MRKILFTRYFLRTFETSRSHNVSVESIAKTCLGTVVETDENKRYSNGTAARILEKNFLVSHGTIF